MFDRSWKPSRRPSGHRNPVQARLGVDFNRRQQLRLAAKNIDVIRKPFGVFVAGSEWFWQYVSPCVLRWLGCDLGELLGHMWTQHVHPSDRELTIAAANQLQAGKNPAPFVQRWLTSTGNEVRLQLDVWWWQRPSGLNRITGRLTNLSVDYAAINAVHPACAEIFRTARETCPTVGRPDDTYAGSNSGEQARPHGPEGDRSRLYPARAEATIERTKSVNDFDTPYVEIDSLSATSLFNSVTVVALAVLQ